MFLRFSRKSCKKHLLGHSQTQASAIWEKYEKPIQGSSTETSNLPPNYIIDEMMYHRIMENFIEFHCSYGKQMKTHQK